MSRNFFHRPEAEKSRIRANNTRRGLLGLGGARMEGRNYPDLDENANYDTVRCGEYIQR